MSPAPVAIVEILWGPLAARRAMIAPGRAIAIGRAAPSDLVVPHDRRLSGVHFEISWDGSRCVLRDRQSALGTWLGGERVMEAEVESGAFIRAGDTTFMVHLEGATARRLPEDPPEIAARKDRARAALAAEAAPLFAVLDAARDPRVRSLVREAAEEVQSLYDGAEGQALADAAPYLVHLSRGGSLLDRLVREGWGQSWGVYLTSDRPFVEVRRHLRRLLFVRAEGERKRLYFRFYDPRVLRVFLPTCDVRQTDEVFGEIGSFLMEGEDGEPIRFTRPAPRPHRTASAAGGPARSGSGSP